MSGEIEVGRLSEEFCSRRKRVPPAPLWKRALRVAIFLPFWALACLAIGGVWIATGVLEVVGRVHDWIVEV